MPNPRRARRAPALLAAVLTGTFALVATTLSTPAQASDQPSSRAAAAPTQAKKAPRGLEWRAQHALARAKKALAPDTPAGERPDATLALRNLWLLKDGLSGEDRAAAERLAQRPVKPLTMTDGNLTLHYDPAQLGYPVNDAFNIATTVANTYAGSGYRRPKPDQGKGGDNTVDIYIDTLEPGLYGYCTTDQKRLEKPGHYDVWAYCVVDNDYAGFPRTPIENLAVTMAHEYYHATQFAYDIAEDGWFMEATATWAEDEVYTAVNDNVQYLNDSPITKPGRSMDKFGGVFHYGVWSYFRYLTERITARTGAMPGLPLKMWQLADSSKGPRKDKYSTQAINKALRKMGKTSLPEQFANFSAATRFPGVTFSEGAANAYPAKKLAGAKALKKRKKKVFRTKLDHLASATFQFVPNGTKSGSKLKLGIDMANRNTGSRAVIVIYGTDGSIKLKQVKLNARGNKSTKVAFGSDAVAAVEVTLVNTSTRYRNCYRQESPFSCSGRPVDDNLRALVRGQALK